MKSGRAYLLLTVFISGMTTLAVELSASRLLDPYFGNSNLIWANLIGLILIYLTAGYYLGGHLADRFPRPAFLYQIIAWAAFFVGLVPFAAKPLLGGISGEGPHRTEPGPQQGIPRRNPGHIKLSEGRKVVEPRSIHGPDHLAQDHGGEGALPNRLARNLPVPRPLQHGLQAGLRRTEEEGGALQPSDGDNVSLNHLCRLAGLGVQPPPLHRAVSLDVPNR